jgi:hypothetical protein
LQCAGHVWRVTKVQPSERTVAPQSDGSAPYPGQTGVGYDVGDAVGFCVVGTRVGTADGTRVGVAVGAFVGVAVVGTLVGVAVVGLFVGAAVGDTLGAAVGAAVGGCVGASVGYAVPKTHAVCVTLPTSFHRHDEDALHAVALEYCTKGDAVTRQPLTTVCARLVKNAALWLLSVAGSAHMTYLGTNARVGRGCECQHRRKRLQ